MQPKVSEVLIGGTSILVSNFGKVWYGGRELEAKLYSSGYLAVNFGGMTVNLHHLMGRAFVGEPPVGDYVVDHIDGDKLNNSPDNLQWLSRGDNVKKSLSRPVQASLGGTGLVFPSAREAERAGFNAGHISSCANGRRKTHKKYNWSFI